MQVPLAINTATESAMMQSCSTIVGTILLSLLANVLANVLSIVRAILPAGTTQVVLEAGGTVIAVHTVRLEARLRSLVGRNGQEDMNLNGLSQLIGCLCISISRQRTIGA